MDFSVYSSTYIVISTILQWVVQAFVKVECPGDETGVKNQFITIISSWRLGSSGSVVRPLLAGAKGLAFNSPITQHVHRFISWTFTYSMVGSLDSNWSYNPTTWNHLLLNWVGLGRDNLGSFPSYAWNQLQNNLGQNSYECTLCISSLGYLSYQGQ